MVEAQSIIGTPRWARLSWEEAKTYIRRQLAARGTDVRANDEDPYGDGDQSNISTLNSQFYRELFSAGGDINHLADLGLQPLSEFAKNCISGHVKEVKRALERAKEQSSPESLSENHPPDALQRLLEKRETSLRLSPLLMIVSMGKNVHLEHDEAANRIVVENQVAVAKLLLEYGARPNAKDVCGKTVCHYGMGWMATNMTLEVCDLCIEAHKSSFLQWQKVELHGLQQQASLNGVVGFCQGYLADNGRRSVFLIEEERKLAIKPDNLKLWNQEADKGVEKLCDIPDRLQAVCLLEVIQGKRTDVADILLNKHFARLDIKDCDGVSPDVLARNTALISPVSRMVNEATSMEARGRRKIDLRTCSNCGKVRSSQTKLLACSGCQGVAYCKKECQLDHWRVSHKKECKDLASLRNQAILLDPPKNTRLHSVILNMQNCGPRYTRASPESQQDGFRQPSSVRVGEKFYVKVQGSSIHTPLMVYDQSRECNFEVFPGEKGFTEMLQAVNDEPTWGGRKTFIMTSFDEKGLCTVYPGMTSIKTW
jgi:hypothetical protein